jgi:hypothetical protein
LVHQRRRSIRQRAGLEKRAPPNMVNQIVYRTVELDSDDA